MSENNRSGGRSPAPDLEALTRAYQQSMQDTAPTHEQSRSAEVKEAAEDRGFVPKDYRPRTEATPEHDKIVDKIKAERRKRSHSVWTDNPVLKPKKSVWIDDEGDEPAAVSRPAARQPEPVHGETVGDRIAPLPVMAEQPKEVSRPAPTPRTEDREDGSILPLLNAKPRKQELVLDLGSEGSARVTSLPQRVNKQRITVDMSGYRERQEEEPHDSRNVYEDMPYPAEKAEEKPFEEEKLLGKRTVSLKMPISKIDLGDLEPVRREDSTEERAEAVPEEVQEELPPSEETAEQAEEICEEETAPAESEPQGEDKKEETEEEYNFSDMINKVRAEKKDRVREDYDKGGVSEHTLITERAQLHGAEQQYPMPPRRPSRHKKPPIHELEFRFINCIMCVCMLFAIFFSMLFMERESDELDVFPEFSVSALLSGEYTKGIGEYFTYTIPGRSEFVKVGEVYDSMKGIGEGYEEEVGVQKPRDNKDSEPAADSEAEESLPDSSSAADDSSAPEQGNETAELTRIPDDGPADGDVIVFGEGEDIRAVAGYHGTLGAGSEYAKAINKYKEALPEVNVYNMTIPTSAAYYLPDSFKDMVSDQKDSIDNIAAELRGIINADVYDVLGSHADEYIYSRTDHRWQPLGAYYAGKVFADKAGVDHAELDSYEENSAEGFLGTLYAKSGSDDRLGEAPDTFIYYKPDNEYTVTYYDAAFTKGEEGSLFGDPAETGDLYYTILGSDDRIAEITTDVTNGRTLVIFKDSFGNALVPFFTNSFEKIYVCDHRYFKENAIEFCQRVGCTDLLFAVSVTSCSGEDHITAINNDRVRKSPSAGTQSDGSDETPAGE